MAQEQKPPQSATRHLPGLKLEPLEPRFLLSADIIPFRIDMLGEDGGAQYSLKYDNLIQAVKVFDDRSGLLIDSRSAQEIDPHDGSIGDGRRHARVAPRSVKENL